MSTSDVVVVGGGMAGVSVAAQLASHGSVVLLEGESELAYHTTGRSAAIVTDSYGSHEIQALTRASRPYIDPELLSPRPLLYVADTTQLGAMEAALAAYPQLTSLMPAEAIRLCSALRASYLAAAALDHGTQDIDVLGLHQQYVSTARRKGAQIIRGARVLSGVRHREIWRLETTAGPLETSVVVNAGGAWGDDLAVRCGVDGIGLRPLRRTIAIARADGVDRAWPLVVCVEERFYLRPEGTGILISPADETPCEPCDARALDIDVARAIERVNDATTLGIRSIQTSWAGLRTFLPDRNPAVGFDPLHEGFFWLVGQGGYGIQTAPALARLAAGLITGSAVTVPSLDPVRLAPRR